MRSSSRIRLVLVCLALTALGTVAFAVLGLWQAAAIGLVTMQLASLVLALKSYVRAPTRTALMEVDRRVDAAASRALTETLALGDAIEQLSNSVAKDQQSSIEERQLALREITSLGNQLASEFESTQDKISELRQSFIRGLSHQLSQVDALFQLHRPDMTAAPMPLTGGWAIGPSSTVVLLDLIDWRRPELVVELGSGTSTVWIARGLDRVGTGRLVTIEHDSKLADETRVALERNDVGHRVDLRVAPLGNADLGDHKTPWYDRTAITDIDNIHMLFVDGPPQRTGPMARYPALPVLFDRLTTDAIVVVDDSRNSDESAMIDRWTNTYPRLEELTTVPRSGLRVLRKV